MTLQELTEELNSLMTAGYGDRRVIMGDDWVDIRRVTPPDDVAAARDDNEETRDVLRTVWLEP